MRLSPCAHLLVCGGLLAQNAPPSFTVASIRLHPMPANPKALEPGNLTFGPARFTSANVPLRQLVMTAFDVLGDQLSGGPAWIYTDRYDIEAAADKETPKEQMKLMLQSLLAERFHLEIRRETRPTNVYVLIVGTNGPKFGVDFHEVAGDAPKPDYPFVPGGPTHMRLSMKQLASFLTQTQDPDPDSGRPVIDETGLDGTFDIVLTGKNGDWIPSVERTLGLKLESRKISVEYLVITRLDRPSAN